MTQLAVSHRYDFDVLPVVSRISVQCEYVYGMWYVWCMCVFVSAHEIQYKKHDRSIRPLNKAFKHSNRKTL